jgi:hypothetical protein
VSRRLRSLWVGVPFQSFPNHVNKRLLQAWRRVQRTIIHLLPSNSFLDGFFIRMLSGLGFLPGAGLLPRADGPSETVELVRREGFLCVISDLSTFLRPEVTDSPLLSSEKTAPKPPAAGAGAGADSVLISRTGGGPGGGGGGGGGGAPPAAGAGAAGGDAGLASEASLSITCCTGSPLGFQGMPEE